MGVFFDGTLFSCGLPKGKPLSCSSFLLGRGGSPKRGRPIFVLIALVKDLSLGTSHGLQRLQAAEPPALERGYVGEAEARDVGVLGFP